MATSGTGRLAISARLAAACVTLCASFPARADKDELYTLIGYEAGASHYLVPQTGPGSVTAYAGTLDLTAYYGLTHTIHVGGRISLTSSSDVHFVGATVTLPGGTQSSGDVWSDHLALGLGALVLYRLDTGLALAPALELEGGFTIHQYRNIMHVPAGVQFGESLGNAGETVLHGSATFLVEYRFRNRWIASTGLAIHGEPNGPAPWSVFVPFRVGRIW